MSAAPPPPDPACTGIAASWCPVHGYCTCPREDDGSPVLRYELGVMAIIPGLYADALRAVVVEDPACPLHSAASTHP